MRNFFQLAAGLDFGPVLNALARQPDLWNLHTLRTTYPGSVHCDVDDIWLFFNEERGDGDFSAFDDRQTKPYPAWDKLPQVRPFIFDLMRRVEGVQLGRVIITRLPPGKSIAPHEDAGAPASFYTRYQLALQCHPGCVFNAGDESVNFRVGDVWQFDNQQTHSVINNSADDRIVLIVDIKSA